MIRRARAEDLARLLELVKAFADHYGTKRSLFPKDQSTARRVVRDFMDNHVLFVSETKGQVTGVIAGYFTRHPFNPEIICLNETFWWVEPEHRGSFAGAKLLRAFAAFGKARADWVTLSLLPDSPIKADALEKRGFKLKEQAFLLEVDQPGGDLSLP